MELMDERGFTQISVADEYQRYGYFYWNRIITQQ